MDSDRPVLLAVDDEVDSLDAIRAELDKRYGRDYEVLCTTSPQEALGTIERLVGERRRLALILADQWMPSMTGVELLSRVREHDPDALRGLLIAWLDSSVADAILRASTLGQMDYWVTKPWRSGDEIFHVRVTEFLAEWWSTQPGGLEGVRVVGPRWEQRSHEIRDLLARNGVPFGFYASGSPRADAILEEVGATSAALLVVVIHDGRVLEDPSNADVGEALGVHVRPSRDSYELAVVGAGPAGLSAAVYGSSQGLTTALIEREAMGGQAGQSSLIRNYLGFPRGVTGGDLAQRAYEQAWLFGAEYIYGNEAVGLARSDDTLVLTLRDGSAVRTRAAIVAGGVSYRRLGIPSLEALNGAGVFYGAATTEARGLAGEHVFVVGGGNSAGQAAMHLSKYARRVSVLVRSDSLAQSMSDYLIKDLENASNIGVRYDVEVTGGGGRTRLESLELTDRHTGSVDSMPAAALFVLIGAEPATEWLPESVQRDRWGYILTGPDLEAGTWRQERPPLQFETSMVGVFAAGDVRHGSLKRVASAVGEGAVAVRLVHEYLAL